VGWQLNPFAIFFVMGMPAAIAIPNFVKARNQAQYHACQSNLKMIQGAKEMWPLEIKRAEDAAPTEADLFGVGKLAKVAPACPAGGRYSLQRP
jgi:competence protein ComGC